MSEFNKPSETLNSAWSRLRGQWDATRGEWRDSVALGFETDHWTAWQDELPAALNSLRRLEEAIGDAERGTRFE